MKNADKPAYPQSNNEIVKAFLEVEQESPNGLSKREAFAMAAMQGLISNHTLRGPVGECAENAVNYADALLAELDK